MLWLQYNKAFRLKSARASMVEGWFKKKRINFVCNKALVLTAVLFFSNTFHNITGIDEARQLKQKVIALNVKQMQ